MRIKVETLWEKIAEKGYFAPGIPSEGAQRDLPKVLAPENWKFTEQKHKAERAGLHSDVRLSDGRTAFSWASRKGIPPPGKAFLAQRQPDHDPGYMTFRGRIHSQYGRGDVRLNRHGLTRVTSITPDKVKFALLDKKNPQEMMLLKTPKYGKDSWLLKNLTPTVKGRKDITTGKPHMKERGAQDLGHYLSDRYALEPKIDGAHVIVNLGKRTEVFSHQPGASGELINHTYITGMDKFKPSGDLKGTQVRAEVYAVKGGKVLPIQELGRLMNSSPQKALSMMERDKIKMYLAPFKVIKSKGKPMDAAPYSEHLKVLRKVVKGAPDNVIMPDVAITKKDKKSLIKAIQAGKHDVTVEGLVAWSLKGTAESPVKIKYKEHYQVYIDEIFPMKSKGKTTALAGGFTYRLTPKGRVAGKVGTGFNMKLRKEMWDERRRLKGKKVIIESQGQYPSGAYRAPAFVSLHL